MALQEAARVIVLDPTATRILMMERWKNGEHYYSFIGGGHEDYDESLAATAVREAFEETRVQVSVERKLYEVRTSRKHHHFYLCAYVEGEPLLADDSPEAQQTTETNRYRPLWLSLVEFETVPMQFWEVLRPILLRDIQAGFDSEVTTLQIP